MCLVKGILSASNKPNDKFVVLLLAVFDVCMAGVQIRDCHAIIMILFVNMLCNPPNNLKLVTAAIHAPVMASSEHTKLISLCSYTCCMSSVWVTPHLALFTTDYRLFVAYSLPFPLLLRFFFSSVLHVAGLQCPLAGQLLGEGIPAAVDHYVGPLRTLTKQSQVSCTQVQ